MYNGENIAIRQANDERWTYRYTLYNDAVRCVNNLTGCIDKILLNVCAIELIELYLNIFRFHSSQLILFMFSVCRLENEGINYTECKTLKNHANRLRDQAST